MEWKKDLHLVATEVFVGKTIEVVAQLIARRWFSQSRRNFGVFQNLLVDKDWAIHAQSESERVARTRIDHGQLAVALNPDHGVKRVVFQIADDNFVNARFQP